MSKINRSEMWKKVKSFGDIGELKWTSKTANWQAFIIVQEQIQKIREEAERSLKEAQEEQYRNTHETIAEISRKRGDTKEDVKQIIDDIREKLNELPAGKIIRLSNGQEFTTGEQENNQLANRIFQACEYNGEVTADYEIFDIDVQPEEDNQAYRLGDVNCLLNPIISTIENKIANSESSNTIKKYSSMLKNACLLKEQFLIHGATKELIQKLANATLSTIKVYDVINETYLKYKQTKQAESTFKFKFTNTRYNHVDLWDGKNNNFMISPNPDIVFPISKINRSVGTFDRDENDNAPTKETYKQMIKQQILDQIQPNYGNHEDYMHMDTIYNQLVTDKQTFKFSKMNNKIIKINTGDQTYICSEYALLIDREQAINDLFNPFAISIRKERYNPILKKMVQCYEGSLIKMAMNQSGRVALQPRTSQKLTHIDMIAGYTQFQNLPEQYNYGFPLMTDQRKVTSVDFAIKHNGLYHVVLTNLPRHISAIFKEKTPYSLCSAIIKYLRNNKVNIQISGGMYGCSADRLFGSQFIELPADCQVSSYGKKPYYTAVSKWAIGDDSYKQDFFTFDPEMASIIRSTSSHIIIKKDENEYTQIIKKENKDRYKTKAHLYAFILQYQQLNMMLQLEKMNMDKVHLLCGDDIYFEKHDFEMLPIFRNKGKDNYDIIYDMTEDEGNTFIVNSNDQLLCEFGDEEPVYNQFQLHLGQGGSGKTYARHADIGSINQVYLTLTNALVRDQKDSPFKPKCYTKDKFLANMTKHKFMPSNFIIDEAGLVGDKIREEICDVLTGARIYMIGDKYQISGEYTEENSPFNENKYDCVLREEHFKTDYRAINCPKLQKVKLQIRKMVDMGHSEQEQYFAVHKIANQITQSEWIKQYKTSQIITVCSNSAKDMWTEKLSGEKYRVAKTFTHNGIQYCTGDILTELPQGYDYVKDQKNKTPKINKQHGYTCHSLQGMTQHDKLLITFPSKHDIFKGYVYTAVSRLTKLEDLFALNFNFTD